MKAEDIFIFREKKYLLSLSLGECMDSDIREIVHSELAPCSAQNFIDRYLELDQNFAIDEIATEINDG